MVGDADERETLLRARGRREREEVFARLFTRHADQLRAVLARGIRGRLAQRLEVLDVLQDTYMEAVRRLDEYLEDPGVSLGTWLRFLATQRLKMHYRRHLGSKKRDLRREVPLGGLSSTSTTRVGPEIVQRGRGDQTPSQDIMRHERSQIFRQALENLSDVDQQIVLLRDFDGLPSSEVARRLKIGEAAVRQRHARALRKLREVLRNAVRDGSGYWR